MITRRRFLAGVAASAASTVLAKDGVGIVDTHTHFYDPTRPQGVPWPPKSDATLYRKMLPPEYIAMASPHGVSGTVVVEASGWLEDNQWLLDLAAAEPFLLAVVGNLDPLDADFARQLTRFTGHPKFRGIRTAGKVLAERGRESAFLESMRRLAGTGRSLDLNGGPAYIAHVPDLARAVPDLRIILDHVASAGDPKKLTPEWREAVRAAAANTNVYCKLSGLPEQARPTSGPSPTEMEYYRPILDFLWEVFGEKRLVFGSNWPVSDKGAPFADVMKITRTYLAEKGADAMARVFRTNAAEFYRWPRA